MGRRIVARGQVAFGPLRTLGGGPSLPKGARVKSAAVRANKDAVRAEKRRRRVLGVRF